jgi:hypothetical protein
LVGVGPGPAFGPLPGGKGSPPGPTPPPPEGTDGPPCGPGLVGIGPGPPLVGVPPDCPPGEAGLPLPEVGAGLLPDPPPAVPVVGIPLPGTGPPAAAPLPPTTPGPVLGIVGEVLPSSASSVPLGRGLAGDGESLLSAYGSSPSRMLSMGEPVPPPRMASTPSRVIPVRAAALGVAGSHRWQLAGGSRPASVDNAAVAAGRRLRGKVAARSGARGIGATGRLGILGVNTAAAGGNLDLAGARAERLVVRRWIAVYLGRLALPRSWFRG